MKTIAPLLPHVTGRIPFDAAAIDACKRVAQEKIHEILGLGGAQRDSVAMRWTVNALTELAGKEDALAVGSLFRSEGAEDRTTLLDAARQHFVTSAMCWEALEDIARESTDSEKLHVVAKRAATAAKRWKEVSARDGAGAGEFRDALRRSKAAFQEHVFELLKKENVWAAVTIIREAAETLKAAGMDAESDLTYTIQLLKDVETQRPGGSED